MKITNNEATKIIIDSIASLVRSGTISTKEEINGETVLLGKGSVLDSLGFITLVTDLEDRLEPVIARETYLVLDDINEFNINNPALTVAVLAQYIEKLSQ